MQDGTRLRTRAGQEPGERERGTKIVDTEEMEISRRSKVIEVKGGGQSAVETNTQTLDPRQRGGHLVPTRRISV